MIFSFAAGFKLLTLHLYYKFSKKHKKQLTFKIPAYMPNLARFKFCPSGQAELPGQTKGCVSQVTLQLCSKYGICVCQESDSGQTSGIKPAERTSLITL